MKEIADLSSLSELLEEYATVRRVDPNKTRDRDRPYDVKYSAAKAKLPAWMKNRDLLPKRPPCG